MSRIALPNSQNIPEASRQLLEQVRTSLGVVPNFVQILSLSPATLSAFVGLFSLASNGVLSAATRERIALAISESNGCQYCVSVHSTLARDAGLDEADIVAARQGQANDPRSAAAVTFALALLQSMGAVSNADYEAARAVLRDDEIIEVIGHVALNVFTNMLGKSTKVAIDFPQVELFDVA